MLPAFIRPHLVFRILSLGLGLGLLPGISQAATDTTTAPAPLFLSLVEAESPGAFPLAHADRVASIHYSDSDATVVRIAATALGEDINRVTGRTPLVTTGVPQPGAEPILIGTLGHSPLIDQLVASGKLDASFLTDRWEAYIATVIAEPVPGISRALVIAGSDRRGTAFGVFGLSETIGVSPWYWWANVPTHQRDSLHLDSGRHEQPSPAVKYRGIFLNDEDWGLQPWAAQTFEPETGNIGPRAYARVFELLLRLGANTIWPAMHEFPVQTTPFYLDPRNALTADDHAIVISTSHHEPMLRNSHEYDEDVQGPYNYWTNRESILRFWEERVAATANFENIYTMGLRGRTDAGMLAPADATNADKAAMIQNTIIPDQRHLLATHVNPDPAQVPQIFIPYKETLVQYQSGLQLPDDITILWPDDNHGYIRQLPNHAEQQRAGGSGVYYHLSYWGVPRSYLWLCTTPPGMIRAEMLKAWDFNAHRMWLVNVGDLKPHEIGTDFFLRLARDPEAFRDFDERAYLRGWADRIFGSVHAATIADLLDRYYGLNIAVRPEHLNRDQSGFDFIGSHGRGDEAAARLEAFARLDTESATVLAELPAAHQSAFYELVHFPIRFSHLVNRKVLLAERSRLWAAQGRAATDHMAKLADAADADLRAELETYNRRNADGKWNLMFNPMPTTQLPRWAHETQSPFHPPHTARFTPPASAGLGVAVEGAADVLSPDNPGRLPPFHRATDRRRFIDLFDTGTTPSSWQAQASAPWVRISQAQGIGDARIEITIDWSSVPPEESLTASLHLRSATGTHEIQIEALNPPSANSTEPSAPLLHVGELVIEAEHFDDRHDRVDGTGWQRLSGAAVHGDGMGIVPVTAPSLDPAISPLESPTLYYTFDAVAPGEVEIAVECLPTHRLTSDHAGLRYSIALDDESPQILDLHANEYTPAWNANVMRAHAIGRSQHALTTAGRHRIALRMVDAGLIIDRLIIRPVPPADSD